MADISICIVEHCIKPAARGRRGMCLSHYKRWHRYGDASTVKKITNGEAQRFFAEEVMTYEGNDCLIWPYAKYSSGYGHMSFEGKDITVSRLVCEKAYGPAPTPAHHAAHGCGNGGIGCVAKAHLRWATPVENNQDKFDHGTLLHGEKAPGAKLTEEQVREIISLKGKLLQREIAEKFGVTRHNVSLIQNGKRWCHVLP